MIAQEQRPPKSGKRVRTPTVIQMEAVECGAAALGIVMAHYGLRIPLEELRVACGVSRDGSKASKVLKAARTYGMTGKGLRKEPAGLQDLKPPYIVFWNFNHFVVVEGFGKGKVFLNDPACGHRFVTDEEFECSFTGVVLVMEPGPDFERGGRRPSVFKGISERLAGFSSALAFCVLAGF